MITKQSFPEYAGNSKKVMRVWERTQVSGRGVKPIRRETRSEYSEGDYMNSE